MMIGRRGFLFGAGALLLAPAIVRAANIMPVRAHCWIIEEAQTNPVLRSSGWELDFVTGRYVINGKLLSADDMLRAIGGFSRDQMRADGSFGPKGLYVGPGQVLSFDPNREAE